MRLLANETIALVVDYQERLLPVIADSKKLERRTCALLKGLRALEVPLLVTQQYTKGIGMTVPAIREAAGTDRYFDKLTFSCLQAAGLLAALEASGRKTVLVCGIEAHICVLQTCIDLKAAGYLPVLVADCIGSRKPEDRALALQRAAGEGILLTSAEAILFELLQKAGSPVFKEISGLVKAL